jgi:threonine synthase
LANAYSCPACSETLEVHYEVLPSIDHAEDQQGMWQYRSVLPVSTGTVPVTLGEGDTPLLPALHLESEGRLLLKNETVNPTGSFKDRPASIATTMAREFGLPGVICASTGNTGVSTAAYAARARLPAVCLVPEAASSAKLAQITAAGARLVEVRGTYSDAYQLAQGGTDQGWANLTSTYINPYMLEADKLIGYELFNKLWAVPDWVFVPVGAGPLLAGIYKAFEELRAMGLARQDGPRMVAVQAEGCAPIVDAWRSGTSEVAAWEQPITTRALSIADPLRGYASEGSRTLSAVRNSHGAAVAVTEADILEAVRQLAICEGLLVEPGSAAALAGYWSLKEEGLVGSSETAVLVLTGHGLKDVDALRAATTSSAQERVPLVEAGDGDALAQLLQYEIAT